MSNFTEFASKDDLARGVAAEIAASLSEAVQAKGSASFVASGGGTPKPALDLLAINENVPWAKVSITLSDERIAPAEADVSNAEMLRTHLLKDAASGASFIPLETVNSLDSLTLPFDVVLLGMGGDGHFASIFPQGEGMTEACANDAPVLVETTPSPLPPEAPYPRLSLSHRAIISAHKILLMVSGESKKHVLDLAMSDAPEGDLPIRKLVQNTSLPLQIFWAP